RLPSPAQLIPGKLAANDPQKPVVAAYEKSFKEVYKQDVSTFGGYAYDGLMLAVEAIRKAGSTDKAKVRDAIEATRGFVGTSGTYNMSATDHLGLDLSSFRMLEVKGGQWTLARYPSLSPASVAGLRPALSKEHGNSQATRPFSMAGCA